VIDNIVLVHGAFADGSSWNEVIRLLQARGFNVTAVQQPLTSLDADVAITRHVLDLQDGPTLLVGHSYGGVIITVAGNAPNVAGLVYIAAYAPDEGENIADLKALGPATAGGAHVKIDTLGYAWIEREAFRDCFAADVDPVQARVMSATQMPWKIPTDRVSHPAWRSRPCWYQVSSQDQMISPKLQALMAERMGAQVVTLEASHASAVSQPGDVADLIASAAESLPGA
jgi:pimeloyl-ACP methyl ester carboxylesterase